MILCDKFKDQMRIASYNVMIGGFDNYKSTSLMPERLDKLKEAIKEINADFIALDDTFRWVEIFSDKDLCQLFNYSSAYHINMDDVRVDKRVGITVMTNLPNPNFSTLRLGTRNCVKTTIHDSKPLDIYSVYLDDLKEETRLNEVSYLLKDISPLGNSIILGDLNTTRPEGVSESKKLLNDLLITNPLLIFKKVLDYLSYFRPVFRDMFKAEVMSRLRQQGFKDARPINSFSPSAPTPLYHGVKNPIVEIDHILASTGTVTSNFQVLRGGIFDQASDHYPVVTEFE